MNILRLRLRPGVLQGRASRRIVVGIVARATNGDGSDQTTTNGAVQRSPSWRRWPAVITGQAAALTGGARLERRRGNGRCGQRRNGYQPGLHSGVIMWWKVKRWRRLADQKWEVRVPIASLNRRQGGNQSRCSRFYGMSDGHQAPRSGLERSHHRSEMFPRASSLDK